MQDRRHPAPQPGPSVVHLTSVHQATDTRILVKEGRTLAEAGYGVTLVAPADRDEERHGVSIRAVAPPAGRLARMTATARRVYRHARALRADVYHFHDPELMPFAMLLRRGGASVVYDVHEDLPRDILSKEWIPKPVRRAVAAFMEALERAVASRVDAVVAATPTIGRRFAEINPRTVVVNNYPLPEPTLARAPEASLRESAVCYVGDLTAIRGVIEMVDAAGLADVKLLLGGTFSEPGLRERAEARDGWSRVSYLGQLRAEEVRDVFARARAGLVLLHPEPNHVNAQPNKLFEYMAAALPVVASDFELWREVVEGRSCGLCVDPLDASAIAEAIRTLVDHPEEAAEMGRRGREAVESTYNWRPEARKLLDLYAGLAGG